MIDSPKSRPAKAPLKYVGIALLSLLIITLPLPAYSQEPVIASLQSSEGVVEVMRAKATKFVPATSETRFYANDVIHTGANSRAAISFSDGGFLRLAESSSLQFQPRNAENTRSLSMDSGKGYFFGREPKAAPIISTPSVTTAIRGTEFVFEVSANRTVISVLDGMVKCTNAHGEVSLTSNEQATTDRGKAPVKSILLNPLNAVQWALRYPPILVAADLGDALQTDASLATAWSRYTSRDRGGALNALSAYSGKHPQLASLLRVSLLLSAGDVQRAQQEIERSSAGPDDSRTSAALLAHRAIIALTLNHLAEAQALIAQAKEKSSESPAVLFAASFVSQAALDLDAAKAAALRVTQLAPNSAYALARLAELESAFGEAAASKAYAEEALALDPNDPYVLTVNGFSRILRQDTEGALQSFNRAIQNGADGMSHLGRGLVLIKSGQLEDGQKEIEQAAFLEPQVSLYRSYLGKAFFELERSGMADHELARAIELDSRDPTPLLYRAFNRLSANDPIGALEDVERSIELNDNRAVYRSRFLLDRDLGVRSAGLGQVFNAIGFSQAARVEAIKSINRDYLNYSGHFLLSDSYQSIVLANASLAEARLANLLAPVSFNLFNRQSGDASFNEYSALFERPEQKTELSFRGSSSDDLIGPGARFAWQGEQLGYALSARSSLTGGSKENNFTRQNNVALLSALQLSPDDRVSFGGSVDYERIENNQSDPNETQLNNYEIDLGYTHRWSPHSTMVIEGSISEDRNLFIAEQANRAGLFGLISGGETSVEQLDLLLDESSRERLHSARGSVQYLFASDYLSSIIGLQGNHSDVTRNEQSSVLDTSVGSLGDDFGLTSRGAQGLNSYDLYNYTTIHPWQAIDVTLAGTYSSVALESREITPFTYQGFRKDRFNPKIGITAYPSASVTLRSAYFETLRKSSLENALSIEPTLVGGINQRFNDFSGAAARNLGAGIDYKYSGFTYLGAEVIGRHVTQPAVSARHAITYDDETEELSADQAVGTPFDTHQDQVFINGYLGQILTPRISAVLNYSWSQFKITDPDAPQDVRLHKIDTTVRYFDKSGLFPFAGVTWRDQQRENSDVLDDGVSAFWTTDLGVGYRIPERHGVIIFKISNLFDEEFSYDQSFGTESSVRPGIEASLLATFNF